MEIYFFTPFKFCGPVESSFEKPTKNLWPKVRKCNADRKVVKTHLFGVKSFPESVSLDTLNEVLRTRLKRYCKVIEKLSLKVPETSKNTFEEIIMLSSNSVCVLVKCSFEIRAKGLRQKSEKLWLESENN